MKLEDWLFQQLVGDISKERGLSQLVKEKSEGLHVIGICGECGFWAKNHGLGTGDGSCQIPETTDANICNLQCNFNFGCIHFKKRRVANENTNLQIH